MKRKLDRISTDELKSVIASSRSIREVSERLGYNGNGSSHLVRDRCVAERMDLSHFTKRPRHTLSDFTGLQYDVVIGSMLGDGSVSKTFRNLQSSFCESHCVEQKDYLFWKYEILKNYFVREPFALEGNKIKMGKDGKITRLTEKVPFWSMKSMQCEQFSAIEKQWYKRDSQGQYVLHKGRRIKCLPESLRQLTPAMIAVWYCDDGCLITNRKTIRIATNSFSEEEVGRLISMLGDLGINCKLTRSTLKAPMISVYSEELLKFIDLIKPHKPTCDCVDYKFDLSDYKYNDDRLKCTNIQFKEVVELVRQKVPQKTIAEKFGMSRRYLCSLLKGTKRFDDDVIGILNYRNTTGHDGVSHRRDRDVYEVQVQVNKKKYRLGTFKCLDVAALVAQQARQMRDSGVVDFDFYKTMADALRA